MQLHQIVLHPGQPVGPALRALAADQPHWVLALGAEPWLRELAAQRGLLGPLARLVGCSTAGEIAHGAVEAGCCVLTGVHFDATHVELARTDLADMLDANAAGQRLARALAPQGLRAVWLLAQGVAINGSALLDGLRAGLPAQVPVSGGLAGDDGAFVRTHVLCDDQLSSTALVAVGFYGPALRMSYGSFGGWQPFGPNRRVTHSAGNVLYALDSEPALTVYKRYLGEYAQGLPGSGLLFPFLMRGADAQQNGLIRTILGVDEAAGSLILAGDVDPEGQLQLMHASTDRLVDGAEEAALQAAQALHAGEAPVLALLVSCVGRKLVMGGRAEEEVEAVARVLPDTAVLAGFYSYGEVAPQRGELACRLHNQTMTITTFSEQLT